MVGERRTIHSKPRAETPPPCFPKEWPQWGRREPLGVVWRRALVWHAGPGVWFGKLLEGWSLMWEEMIGRGLGAAWGGSSEGVPRWGENAVGLGLCYKGVLR